jgi:ABC-2 type transport system permease protein
VLPIIVNFLPGDWNTNVNKYLLGSAGQSIVNVVHDSGSLSPWAGFALFCGYVAVALAGAGFLLLRRGV